jgi:predicted MFS family arabinose efflux permease
VNQQASAVDAPNGISRGLVLLLALSCGVTVANLYYAQPLLGSLAHAFHTGSGSAGLTVTGSQVGYAVGLAFLVPLGDIAPRRRLVPVLLLATAGAMAVSALAPSLNVLVAVSVLVGLGSVAVQVLVPFAASLASEARRGRVVGTVMSGLLLGILLARTLAGIVAGASSWRVVYWAGAVAAVILAAVLWRVLPPDGERPRLGYGQLLTSTLRLFMEQPALRLRALFGALGFAGFSVFWTTAAFLLSGPPYHYGDTVIGLFGLVGAAGALCASFAGRLGDRGWHVPATVAFTALNVIAFLPLWWGRHGLWPLIVGILVLDIGVQGLQVTNQSRVYALAGEARSRANSAYMVCYFIGGAAGSAVAGNVYGAGGWAAVCALGAGIGALGLVVALWDLARQRRVTA